MEPTDEEPPYTTSTLPDGAMLSNEGYGSPRAGVATPGMATPGSLRESAQTAASRAKGTTTPSVKEMASGSIAALLAGITVYSAKAPSWGRPLAKLMACLLY
jgi:hypothetical protein